MQAVKQGAAAVGWRQSDMTAATARTTRRWHSRPARRPHPRAHPHEPNTKGWLPCRPDGGPQPVGRCPAAAARYCPGVAPNSLLNAWEKAYGLP
ncbi:hypothetical protein GCM10023237_02540 [Streptomyces coeruleoprunus]